VGSTCSGGQYIATNYKIYIDLDVLDVRTHVHILCLALAISTESIYAVYAHVHVHVYTWYTLWGSRILIQIRSLIIDHVTSQLGTYVSWLCGVFHVNADSRSSIMIMVGPWPVSLIDIDVEP
jgi:hypothetical protein